MSVSLLAGCLFRLHVRNLYLKESLEMFRKQSLLPPGEYFCQDGVSHVVADHMGLVHAQLLPQEESVVRGIGHRVNVDILE